MLRSGYSSEAVMRELVQRHLADTVDPYAEKQLIQAGANAALMHALRRGEYQLTDSEIAIANEKLAAQEERAAAALEQSKEVSQPKKTDEAAPRAKTPAAALPGDAVYKLLKGDLVYWHLGSVTHFDDLPLENKKLYLFFFSANRDKTGRKFTPQLIEYYNRVVPQHPELEVIFFSADTSQFGMETYMGQSNMPWPAVAFDKLGSKAGVIDKELVRGIPCLLLVDAAGKVLSNSGDKDAGHEKVLADLDKILARGNPGAVARAP